VSGGSGSGSVGSGGESRDVGLDGRTSVPSRPLRVSRDSPPDPTSTSPDAARSSDPTSAPAGPDSSGGVGGWDPDGTELASAFLDRVRAGGRPAPRSGSGSVRGSRRKRAPGAGWSGPSGDERDPQPLGRAVDRLVGEHGWGQDLAVHGAVARWDQVVGPDVAAHVRPERYSAGELTVRADSTAWATQVKLLAPNLVRRLNEEIGDGTVTRVTVLGPHTPTWRKGPRTVPGRGPRDTYG